MGDVVREMLRLQEQQRLQIQELDIEIASAKARSDALECQAIAGSFAVAALALQGSYIHRERWAYYRRDTWFEETLPHLGERHFRLCFRINSSTFRYLVDICRPAMSREITTMRKPLTVEKRVSIGLYKLCSTAEDRTIAHLFAVGRSTVNETYREFCEVVVKALLSKTIEMVRMEDLRHHMTEFQAVLGFPNAIGALDGCHLPVSPPKDSAVDYHNYKGWYSVVLLALVDHRYKFRYISVGSPGRNNDAHIYGESRMEHILCSYKAQASTVINGVAVPPLVLCDQAFPLTEMLMKPFPSGNLSGGPAQFNYCLSRARRVVENAFGRLKGRFRILMKRMEAKIENVNSIVQACCILHNVCEQLNDTVDLQWIEEAEEVCLRARNVQPQFNSTVQTSSGAAVRNALVKYFEDYPHIAHRTP